MNLFTYLLAKKGKRKINKEDDLFSYLLGKKEFLPPEPPQDKRILDGVNFNILVKNLNTTGATIDTNDLVVTKIIFDYWNKNYKTLLGNFDDGEDVSYDVDGSIRLFYDATIVYILSKDNIYVNNASSMFQGFTAMTEINFNNFNTSSCTDLSKFLYNCSSLTTQTGMNDFDTSNVVNMETMLRNTNFATIGQDNTYSLNVSNWDTRKVENISNMFRECQATYIDISNFLTPVCSRFRSMFFNCSKLVTLNMENIDMSLCDGVSIIGTANDTNFAYGLNNCVNLINLTFCKNLGTGYPITANRGFSSIYLSTCVSLSHDSILSIFNNVGYILGGSTAPTIYMGTGNWNKTTEEERNIVINKYWHITSNDS